MFDQKDKIIRYKWDAWTGSGYRLRFDAADAEHNYHIEDWSNHVVVDDYCCADIDEALGVLKRFFDIDVAQERTRLANWLPARLQ